MRFRNQCGTASVCSRQETSSRNGVPSFSEEHLQVTWITAIESLCAGECFDSAHRLPALVAKCIRRSGARLGLFL